MPGLCDLREAPDGSAPCGIRAQDARAPDAAARGGPARARGATLLVAGLLGGVLAGAVPATAQDAAAPEQAPLIEQPAPVPKGPDDAYDRGTPRGAVVGFLEAANEGDWKRAAQYLDLRSLPAGARAEDGPRLARQLKTVLDHSLWVNPDLLSPEPEGSLDDGLRKGVDRVGVIDTESGKVSVTVSRVTREDGERIWKFSPETVRRIPDLDSEYGLPDYVMELPRVLRDPLFLDLAVWQLAGFVVLVLLAALLGWISELLLKRIGHFFSDRAQGTVGRILDVVPGPMRLVLALLLFEAGLPLLTLPVRVEGALEALLSAAWIVAVTWVGLRLAEAAAQRLVLHLTRRGQLSATALVPLLRRLLRVAILFVAVLLALRSFGVNVTAVLAGLGVGGIAVALAAQKTVENLFGGITLIADAPVRVGDFCRFGDRVGTVEAIGLRSTRIRTLDRTVVTVPNAEFSALQLENFAHRDRFLLQATIGLRYETSPDQLRHVLVEVKRLFAEHDRVEPDPARIRMAGFGSSSLDLEIFAYLAVADINSFFAVREELLLEIMDIVEASGTGFAFPSQTAYLAQDGGLDPGRTRAAEERVARWRASGENPVPDVAKWELPKLGRIRSAPTEPAPGDGRPADPQTG